MRRYINIISRSAPHLMSAMLTAGILYSGYDLATSLRRPPAEYATPQTEQPEQEAAELGDRNRAWLQRTLAVHMFGVPAEAVPAPVAIPGILNDMTIKGVLFSKNATRSRVLLASAQGNPLLLGVGAQLPTGQRIVAINTDNVVFERSGQRVSVPYPLKPAPINAHFKILPYKRSTSLSLIKPVRAPTNGSTLERLRGLRQAVLKSMKTNKTSQQNNKSGFTP